MIFDINAPIIKFAEKKDGKNIIYAKKLSPDELKSVEDDNAFYEKIMGCKFVEIIY